MAIGEGKLARDARRVRDRVNETASLGRQGRWDEAEASARLAVAAARDLHAMTVYHAGLAAVSEQEQER